MKQQSDHFRMAAMRYQLRKDKEAIWQKIQSVIDVGEESVQPDKSINYYRITGIAASLILLLGAGWYYWMKQPANPPLQWITVTMPADSTGKLQLPDGSLVWLNRSSSIQYPKSFASDARQVRFSGEAYFEIKSDHLHPFLVETSELKVCVTGTAFNISAYPHDSINALTLVEGAVQLSFPNSSAALQVKPSERIEYNYGNQQLRRSKVNTAVYTGWRDHWWQFSNAPLSEVLQQLSQHYAVDFVHKKQSILTARFTGKLDKEKPLRFQLNLIRAATGLHCVEKNKSVFIY